MGNDGKLAPTRIAKGAHTRITGTVGDGTEERRLTPVRVERIGPVVDLDAAVGFSCAVEFGVAGSIAITVVPDTGYFAYVTPAFPSRFSRW